MGIIDQVAKGGGTTAPGESGTDGPPKVTLTIEAPGLDYWPTTMASVELL